MRKKDYEVVKIRGFLETMKMPGELTGKAKQAFLKQAYKFFVTDGKLWRKEYGGRHRVVILERHTHYRLLIESHDQLGHKGYFMT